MENFPPDHSALEDYLRSLNHLFVDITRLTYEKGYEEFIGGYCELRIATLDFGMPTAKLVAAKKLRLGTRQTTPKRLAFRLARELKVWAALQHPHVLPLEGFYIGDEYKTAVLISEYMVHGELKNYIANRKPSLEERLTLVRDLTSGLAYLHTRDAPIRHGDLKPGNVLVNSDRRALLADFGLSKALDTGPTGFTTVNDTWGTTRYSGPEILLLGKPAESLANDIWSWACLVLEALTDKIPFADIQLEPQVILALAQSRSPFEGINTPLYPQQLKNLLTHCLSHGPEDRPTAFDCLGIMESTLLGLKAERSDEFTPQPPEEDQGLKLVRRSGRATDTVIEDVEMDSTKAKFPSKVLPIPSGVVAGRIRRRDSSVLWRGPSNELGSETSRSDPLDGTTTEEQPHQLSTGETDSIEDVVEGERQRERIRADAGPAALSTSAAPNIARHGRVRFTEFNRVGRASALKDGGPPSSGLSHPLLVGPPSASGPLSAGTSGTHSTYPHSQRPRHPGPRPGVKSTLNAQEQRTCRQCGLLGRHKDGKCVERWSPGPAGPGTVCERCQKKMKRVERRGTQDASSLSQQIPLQALSSTQQQQLQLSPRQYYPPLSRPSYPREGQRYSTSEAAPTREFQFQPPLSANSSTWARGSKDWSTKGRPGRTGRITTGPTSQQPKSQKRRVKVISPVGTTANHKYGEDDADADGDMEYAHWEEEYADGDLEYALGEEEDADGDMEYAFRDMEDALRDMEYALGEE